MRILLISMPDNIPLFNAYQSFLPNLALRSLAGNINIHDVEVKILDLIHFQRGITLTIKRAMKEYRPHLVGLTAMSFQYASAKKTARLIKSLNKNTKIAIGGYHATLMFDDISSGPDRELFDFIVRGEGEIAFREIVRTLLLDNPGFDKILGLSFKKDGQFIHNTPRPLQDLNTLSLPKRSGVDLFKVNYGFFRRSEVLETSRGCTYGCNFCSIRHMYGIAYRKFRIERVIQDIKNAKECGTIRIIFADDNITLDTENLKKLCDAILDNGLNDILYSTQAHVRGIASDKGLVRKLSQANFFGLFMGIENPLRRNLKELNKSDIVEEAKRAARYLHEHDMFVMGGFITGNPDDKKGDIDAVFKFAKELRCDFLMLQILTPYPKTHVRQKLAKSNLITNFSDYSTYNGFRSNIRNKHLSSRQIMWKVSFGNIKWYLSEVFNPNNWFNKSKRILPHALLKMRLMTLYMVYQFCLGRYGKSNHRF